jgi:hypothetical protein
MAATHTCELKTAPALGVPWATWKRGGGRQAPQAAPPASGCSVGYAVPLLLRNQDEIRHTHSHNQGGRRKLGVGEEKNLAAEKISAQPLPGRPRSGYMQQSNHRAGTRGTGRLARDADRSARSAWNHTGNHAIRSEVTSIASRSMPALQGRSEAGALLAGSVPGALYAI